MKKMVIFPFILTMLVFICIPAIASANTYVGGTVVTSSNNITGVQGDIYTAAYGVIPNNKYTCAWVMVSSSTEPKYAQVGWAVEKISGVPLCHYFYQACDGKKTIEYDNPVGPAWNSWHTYSVIKNSKNSWVGKEDDAIIGSMTIDTSFNGVEYLNENDSSSTQYIGTKTNKLRFSQVKYYNGSSWQKPSLKFKNNTNSSIDTSKWSSNGYWDSWDSRY